MIRIVVVVCVVIQITVVVVSLENRIVIAPPQHILLVGGTGQIGQAVAQHLLRALSPTSKLVLVGRSSSRANQVQNQLNNNDKNDNNNNNRRVSTLLVPNIWSITEDDPSHQEFLDCLRKSDMVIHTAGPYIDQYPSLLQILLKQQQRDNKSTNCRVYVDVSDPLDYLNQALTLNALAQTTRVTALIAAGAFPGMSNVLAMEAAAAAMAIQNHNGRIRDLYFQYFTAGLGGSGVVNLYITNRGFGDDMVQFQNGSLRRYSNLSGRLLGTVDFGGNNNFHSVMDSHPVVVFAWPFPEAATVPQELGITGSSSAAMGTAPALWNTLLGFLVHWIPRSWWRHPQFSQFLADFSQPLVFLSDWFLKITGIGQTHIMRIDATLDKKNDDAVTTTTTTNDDNNSIGVVSIVQAHESFQQCVGQSCAEFALDCWYYPCSGVFLPEQRYRQPQDRSRIIKKLTQTRGTLTYTGPISHHNLNVGPSNLQQVLEQYGDKSTVQ